MRMKFMLYSLGRIYLTMFPLLSIATVHCQEDTIMQDKFVVVHGCRIHYRIGGEGPGVILLHGYTMTGSQWDPFIRDLTRHFTLIIPDLPRHGRSAPYMNGYQHWADLIAGLLDTNAFARFNPVVKQFLCGHTNQ